jgi:hypothetical protein
MNTIHILANAGVPMIFLTLPPMIVLLIPVILIEFLAFRNIAATQTIKQKIIGLSVANLFSTFIGWPVAWVILVVLQMVTGGGGAHGLNSPIGVILSVTQQAPWLIPYESDLYWMIPVAMTVLMIPFYFVSVYSERWILLKLWKKSERKDVVSLSWRAHIYSYLFLLIVVVSYGLVSIKQK